MFAYISSVFCALALVLGLMNARVGPLTSGVFIAAALLCLSLHLAGVGAGDRERVKVGRRG